MEHLQKKNSPTFLKEFPPERKLSLSFAGMDLFASNINVLMNFYLSITQDSTGLY